MRMKTISRRKTEEVGGRPKAEQERIYNCEFCVEVVDCFVMEESGINHVGIFCKERRDKMKHLLLFMVALGMLVWISAVFGQEEAAVGEEMERELDMRRAQLEVLEYEGEVDFRQEMRKLELAKKRMGLEHWRKSKKHHDDKGGAVLLFVLLIVHILLAIWVYQDIRKRNTGSGIWIVVALLAGLFGTLVYAIVRLGDAKVTS